jgi:glycerol uptake facilitator protein
MARSSYIGELWVEFFGTMILILFGVGVVAQVVTSVPAGNLGDHDSIAWAWGIGVILGVYVAGKLSGGHINPAVTIALAAFKGFPWRKVGPYILAQTAGAFVAALIVRFVYADLINNYDPDHTIKSQFIFSTLPGNGSGPVSVTTAFFDQITGTAILVFVVFALINIHNNPPLSNLVPVVIGLVVVGIGMAWGANAGYAINPARDFGPRLASFITGYEGAFFDQYGSPYFWVPIVGPIVGGLIGAAIFHFTMDRAIVAAEAEPTPVGRDVPQ